MVIFHVKRKPNPPSPSVALLTSLESALPKIRESVAKQRTLTELKSTLTSSSPARSKQRTLSRSQSTLTSSLALSHLESTLIKKGGGGRVSSSPSPNHRGRARRTAVTSIMVVFPTQHHVRFSWHRFPAVCLLALGFAPALFGQAAPSAGTGIRNAFDTI